MAIYLKKEFYEIFDSNYNAFDGNIKLKPYYADHRDVGLYLYYKNFVIVHNYVECFLILYMHDIIDL